ncbi:Ankyrin repeat-containing protein [Glarea lozoyensis ATCC 20868]|uniref:Ankyrin repeat-containing protein n=1 Tax=Glarea lozoyensis (strain ATCC 20868 / MF5171) TaxID=1116229 RepID=S3DWV2_GLAL2|nr:Ankyrin repeat-containing protein [Glarea lozoyensis ATCC 20868]EPE36426.1 Ankyrin repeat-containing protein [Glarea lozoyensis ATCC 20868]
MTRIRLMDLPLELLHDILERFVVTVGVVGFRHALRIRLVNRRFSQGIMSVIAKPGIVDFGSQKGLEILRHHDVISRPLSVDILRYRLEHRLTPPDISIARIKDAAAFLVQESHKLQPLCSPLRYTDVVYALAVADSTGCRDEYDDYIVSAGEISQLVLLDALIAVAFLGNLQMLRHLLSEGADPNTHSSYYRPPLVYAVMQGHLDVVRLLLDSGAYINIGTHFWSEKTTNAPLDRASRTGHFELIKLLLDHPSMVLGGNDDRTTTLHKPVLRDAIQSAAEAGHQDVIQYLVQRPEWDGYVPLETELMRHSILRGGIRGNQEHIIQWMLDIGVNINTELHHDYSDCDYGLLVLEIAATRGRPSIVRLLLENGVNRETQALSIAAENGHVDVARLLLDYPGDINVEHMLVGIEEHGPRIFTGMRSPVIGTPLHEAVRGGHEPMVRLLLERGIDINVPWASEAMNLAIHWEMDSIVTAFVEAKVQI